MALNRTFTEISISELLSAAAQRKADGWSYVQTLAVNTENGIDLIYSFRKDNVVDNLKIIGVQAGTEVPSITDTFLAAFVFENEIHDLFGVAITGIAIDFAGSFYALSQPEPMTIISPAQKAAREKAAKIAAAKQAKEGGQANAASASKEDDFEAKLAKMDPEKAAKARAAMEAKKKKEQEARLADLDPEKAAKVKAALEAKARREAAQAAQEKGEE